MLSARRAKGASTDGSCAQVLLQSIQDQATVHPPVLNLEVFLDSTRTKRLALDLGQIEEPSRKRRASSKEVSFLWRYQLDLGAPLTPSLLGGLVDMLHRHGFVTSRTALRGEQLDYHPHQLPEICQSGGGVTLRGFANEIGVVLLLGPGKEARRSGEPGSRHVEEMVVFVPDEGAEVAGRELLNAVVECIPPLEVAVRPRCGFLSRYEGTPASKDWDDWVCDLDSRVNPRHVYWYQYFANHLAVCLDLMTYQSLGCVTVPRSTAGIAVHLGDMDPDWEATLESVRNHWPYRGSRRSMLN